MKDREKVASICPYCGCGCGFYIIVKDGKPIGIDYMGEHPINRGALCSKGNAALEVVSHPGRLCYPMKKKNGNWVRVTWEKALNLVATKLRDVCKVEGADALGFLSSAKCTNEENYLFQKLARMLGTNNVDHCARLCHASTVVGLVDTLGSGAMTNPIYDLTHSQCIFIIGSNFAENHPIVSQWIWDAKKSGTKVIVADPRYTPTAWMADIYLALKPGTDTALANGMINVIVEERLFNEHFIKNRTAGFDKLRASVDRYSLPYVEAVTGVPQSKIREAAKTYAQARASAIVYCMGITQHTCGYENVVSCADLALICGQVGRPGAGLLPLRGQDNVQGACDMGALAEFLPGYVRLNDEVDRARIFRQWGRNSQPGKPGLTVVEMFSAATEGKLKAMYIMGENPIVSDPNSLHVCEALEKLDFLVVQDIFLTETAELADVVLPAACWAEKEGTVTATSRSVQWRPKILEPPGEAKADLKIICEIGKRLGLSFDYHSAAEVLREINNVVPPYAGITSERVKHQIGGIAWPCPSIEHEGTAILYPDTFRTSDDLGHIIPVEYHPPAEQTSDEYPLILTTGRVTVHYNSGAMTRRTLGLLKRNPALFVELNPDDAEKLEINDRSEVRVFTKRGEVTARAVITPTISQGVVFIPFHFPEANVLTNDALDPKAKIPEFKVAACKIAKIEKDLEIGTWRDNTPVIRGKR
jgi:formate dehydrogenase major subunit